MLWFSSPAHQRRKLFCFPQPLPYPLIPPPTTIDISSAMILSPRAEPVLSYLNTPFSCVLSSWMVPAAVKGYGASLWRAEARPGELERGSWTLGRAKLERRRNNSSTCLATRQDQRHAASSASCQGHHSTLQQARARPKAQRVN